MHRLKEMEPPFLHVPPLICSFFGFTETEYSQYACSPFFLPVEATLTNLLQPSRCCDAPVTMANHNTSTLSCVKVCLMVGIC